MNRRQKELEWAARNRLVKHLEEINSRRAENTVEWVDEAYSERLALQLAETIRKEGSDPKAYSTLRKARESQAYLSEENIEDGRFHVWLLDYSRSKDGWMIVTDYVYEKDGSMNVKLNYLTRKYRELYFSKHAVQRLYKRLRTNSISDVKGVMQVLSSLPEVTVKDAGLKKTIHVDGFGRLELVVDQLYAADEAPPIGDTDPVKVRVNDDVLMVSGAEFKKLGLSHTYPYTWIVKTFIDTRN